MPNGVIYVGIDVSYRVAVLSRAGLRPRVCEDLRALPALLAGKDRPLAVIVAESAGVDVCSATQVAREHTSCPVIVFRSLQDRYGTECDLEVGPFTPPDEWMERLWSVIRAGKEGGAWAQDLRKQSAQNREASRLERARNEELIEDGRKLSTEAVEQGWSSTIREDRS